jgi:hypothetical protein
LVMKAKDEKELRHRLSTDPWADSVLRIESVEPWAVWLGARRLVEG